jgi:hypothetical protein
MRERQGRLLALRIERRQRTNDTNARYQGNLSDPRRGTELAAVEEWFRAERARILAPQQPKSEGGFR